MPQICPQTAAELARLYLRTKGHRPTEFELLDFRQWINQQYGEVMGITDYTGEEVWPERMLFYWQCHRRLLVSVAHNVHPFLQPIENAWFRAIHDHHHILASAGFDLQGEYTTFLYAKETAPESIHWMLYSEIVLQAATAIHTGSYARQKLVKCAV